MNSLTKGIVTCVSCQAVKPKMPTGEYYESGKQIYCDESGKHWNNNQCPVCAESRFLTKTAFINLRQGRNRKSTRTCRRCKKKLPKTRYFHCYKCTNPAYTPSDMPDYPIACNADGII